ncbi:MULTISPECIES: MarR family transcriptional regulator [unclassified Arthrobacter]|uniref:MarR family winged helix-turn-helix transcriptional regulator n=1 Tax=unclassified Arthrobacter TaxID=235627 RepID=UPI001E356EE5|nr:MULTISPECIES: MarR family transcriptional regulator [unclassified Arthrobacter]MCC9144639.1 MarR family transcriptional regulator [Arthrobacter sp. zg-Y919]MDK1275865.1 MarR family transcriptional regulator [Arthrobacter sp. zg.Y919]WIB02775.1 MarR family transcriptional regulator [Arthrobacter sp. zg-Y919]
MTEDAPRWLTDRERQAWLALYAVSGLLPAALDADLFRRARITLFDYHVLAMLSEAEGRSLPMSELASRTNASLSRLSHVVKKLEQRGWVSRTPSPADARVTTAALSEEGMAALEGLAPDHVESVRKVVFDCLSDKDVADLERVGKKVLARLDPCNGILGPNEAP